MWKKLRLGMQVAMMLMGHAAHVIALHREAADAISEQRPPGYDSADAVVLEKILAPLAKYARKAIG